MLRFCRNASTHFRVGSTALCGLVNDSPIFLPSLPWTREYDWSVNCVSEPTAQRKLRRQLSLRFRAAVVRDLMPNYRQTVTSKPPVS